MAKAWTAEDYCQQSARSSVNMIVYDRSEDLDEWLEKFPPSKISSAYGHGWIRITRDSGQWTEAAGLADDSEDNEDNINLLRKDWKEIQNSGQQNSFSEITKLAFKYERVGGVWLFHIKSGAEVDMMWRLLATEFVRKGLSRFATGVKVSPSPTSDCPDPSRMFLVSHSNFTDEDSVFALEKALRRAGINVPMKYKPTVHAWLKIYRSNTLKIRPSIYSSEFFEDTRSFSILRSYEMDLKDSPYRHTVTRTTFWNGYFVKYIAPVADDCQAREDLNKWLDKYVPSSFFQESRAVCQRFSKPKISGWIVLEREDVSDADQNIDDLRDGWNELRKSGCPIDFLAIQDLAKRTGVVSGGWLFHVPNVHKVDILWRTVAEHFASGALKDVATRVLVSPPDPENNDGDHVILSKHKDFTDKDEVHRLHGALRAAGVMRQLCYRPDVFNCLGLFEDNPYGIGPYIYTSRYDVLSRITTITPVLV